MCTQPDIASFLAARFFGPGSPGLRLCERISGGAPDIHAGGLKGDNRIFTA